MRQARAFTLVELLVVVGIIGLLVAILVPTLNDANELVNRTVCMAHLSGIYKAAVLYKGENDNIWPWLYNDINGWDEVSTPVGTNRTKDPFLSANKSAKRSISTLMFMLVRQGQSPGLFRCPSDKNSLVDPNAKVGELIDGDMKEGEYYWDFSLPENVSYSYQAPKANTTDANYVNGVSDSETELIVYADMSPAYEGESWNAADLSRITTMSQPEIAKQLSNNHKGKQINVLRVAGNVAGVKRPDVGDSFDQIYTTYKRTFSTRRTASSVSLADHQAARDTFLIGPRGRTPTPTSASEEE